MAARELGTAQLRMLGVYAGWALVRPSPHEVLSHPRMGAGAVGYTEHSHMPHTGFCSAAHGPGGALAGNRLRFCTRTLAIASHYGVLNAGFVPVR